jgi:hypothetical protein
VIDPVLTNWSSYIGKTKDYVFVLEENVYWNYPIGTPESPFEGVFLGNGYTIDCSNLSDKKSTQDSKKYGGLFGYIGKSGIVKDVHVKGRISGEWVGTFASVNLGLIENCSSSATVKPTERDYYDSWNYTRNTLGVAGLVASNGGKILNCVFNGSISKGDYASFSSATALKIALSNVDNNNLHVKELKDRFERGLKENLTDITINGDVEDRLYANSNVTFNGILGEALLFNLDLNGVCASNGSACSAGSIEPSRALINIGLSKADALSTVRFTFGKNNTVEDVDYAIKVVCDCVNKLKQK